MADSPTLQTKIIHIHIPKTAGTAIRAAFEKAAATREMISPHLEEDNYRESITPGNRYFSGHIGHETAMRIGGEIVVVLRSPIERLVSLYFFWRQLYAQQKDTSLKCEMASRFSLIELFSITDEPILLEPFKDHVMWQLAHGSTIRHKRELRKQGMTDDQVMRLALDNLSAYAVVGIQENMESFVASVRKRLGLNLAIQKINVTKAKVESLTYQELLAFEKHVTFDQYIYSHAVRIAGDHAHR
jgi:hypothetical protein